MQVKPVGYWTSNVASSHNLMSFLSVLSVDTSSLNDSANVIIIKFLLKYSICMFNDIQNFIQGLIYEALDNGDIGLHRYLLGFSDTTTLRPTSGEPLSVV